MVDWARKYQDAVLDAAESAAQPGVLLTARRENNKKEYGRSLTERKGCPLFIVTFCCFIEPAGLWRDTEVLYRIGQELIRA
jgi:hypothetical protein